MHNSDRSVNNADKIIKLLDGYGWNAAASKRREQKESKLSDVFTAWFEP